MNTLNQNKFQARRKYCEAVQLPPGRLMVLLLLAHFKIIKLEQRGMMKHEQFFFPQYAFMNRGYWWD